MFCCSQYTLPEKSKSSATSSNQMQTYSADLSDREDTASVEKLYFEGDSGVFIKVRKQCL